MYLIWEQDELTAEVTRILQERLAAGVEVHILYDWLSSMPYKKAELSRLAEAGAVVLPCYRRLPQLNYRNHMKMVIVDGGVVYSGGMNMGQEYIDGGERFATWRDTHFRLTGPVVVAPYLRLFASTWTANGGQGDLFTGYLPPLTPRRPGEGTPVQVLHSSVSTPVPVDPRPVHRRADQRPATGCGSSRRTSSPTSRPSPRCAWRRPAAWTSAS